MHFGEPVDDDRLAALLRPDEGIATVITADTYGAGAADQLLGRALAGVPRSDFAIVGAIGHDFYTGRARRCQGFPPFHRSAAARPGGLRGLRADGDGAQPGALRRRFVRPAAAAQPGPHGLYERGGVGRAGGGQGGRADADARRRARPGERLHARRDRLPGALRRPDRLGDGDPQPARAVARRAGAAGGRAPRREADHPRRRLRRALPRRRPARARVPALRPPRLPPGGLGRGGAREVRARCGRSPSATG